MEDEKNLSLYAYNLAEDALALAKKAMEHDGGDPEATGYTKEESDARYYTKDQTSATFVTKTKFNTEAQKIQVLEDEMIDVNSLVDNSMVEINRLSTNSATKTELTNGLDGKVDKVSGKGLSTNDYTTADKNKLTELTKDVNQINGILNNGSINKLKINRGFSVFNSSVENGVITLNQIATGTTDIYLQDYPFHKTITGQEFVCTTESIMTVSGDFTTAGILYKNNETEGTFSYATCNGSLTLSEGVIIFGIYIHVVKDTDYTNKKLKIMIRDSSIEDDTFVPYAPSNRELYEMILSLIPSASLMNYTDDLAND